MRRIRKKHSGIYIVIIIILIAIISFLLTERSFLLERIAILEERLNNNDEKSLPNETNISISQLLTLDEEK